MSADFAVILAEMQADFLDELPERCARIEARVMASARLGVQALARQVGELLARRR